MSQTQAKSTLPTHWLLANQRSLPLNPPALMAILNLTPDSFADAARPGGRLTSTSTALTAAAAALAAGAQILDLGAESTRPGAQPVSPSDQLSRLTPVIRAIRAEHPSAILSIDTTSARVAEECLSLGADAINDVSAGLDDPAMLQTVAQHRAGYIAMHRLTAPQHDQYSDRYTSAPITTDITQTVIQFLKDRVNACVASGIALDSIVVDPGLGFGKTVEQNLELLRNTPTIMQATGRPVLSALSRKSFVGRIALGRDSTPEERLPGTLALSTLHLSLGASMLRVHDVAEHAQVIKAATSATPH